VVNFPLLLKRLDGQPDGDPSARATILLCDSFLDAQTGMPTYGCAHVSWL
jgi:hypothetical protein